MEEILNMDQNLNNKPLGKQMSVLAFIDSMRGSGALTKHVQTAVTPVPVQLSHTLSVTILFVTRNLLVPEIVCGR